MNCVSRRCDSPRQIPCSVGRGGQAGEPWTGSLLLGAYESVACRTGMQARVSLVPGRSSRCGPRNTVLWPPGRTGHVAGVSTASPAQPPASWGRKTNSPQRNHGDGGFFGDLPARRKKTSPASQGHGDRAALLGPGVCSWSSGCSGQTGRAQSPRPGLPGTLEAGEPPVGTVL